MKLATAWRAGALALAAGLLLPASAAAGNLHEAQAFVQGIYDGYRLPRPPSYLGSAARSVYAPSLLALIRADQAAAGGEVGALDHDPLCSCQDATISALQLRGRAAGAGAAQFDVRFVNSGQATRLQLDVVRLPDGNWRVADVHNERTPSLGAYLRRSLGRDGSAPR